MYAKRCYRTLDRPIEFFGLEVEDWFMLILASGGLLFLIGPLVAAPSALIGWILLRRLKSGKPPGYLFSLLYNSGAILCLPSVLRPRGLLKPASPLSKEDRLVFSPFFDDSDLDSSQVRFFYDQ